MTICSNSIFFILNRKLLAVKFAIFLVRGIRVGLALFLLGLHEIWLSGSLGAGSDGLHLDDRTPGGGLQNEELTVFQRLDSTYLAGCSVLLLVDATALGGRSGAGFDSLATDRVLAVVLGELPTELAVAGSTFHFHSLGLANHI